ncbi:MAG TPA: hypothetical protein VKA21_17035 [Candidatus Binatia bacterium]|nr:hypothetical protein [Candidatus Binatia bacterium]
MRSSRVQHLLGWPGLFLAGGLVAGILAVAIAAGVIVDDFMAATIFGYTTSGVYDETEDYEVKDKLCTASLMPATVTEVPGTGGNFFTVLSGAFPTWTYASAVTPLTAGSLKVRTYDVQGTPARVGAEFHIRYVPAGTDPTANIHWVQVVTDNHNLTNNPGHGNAENIVDNPFSPGNRAPYYDDGGAAASGNCALGCDFYDFPGRIDTDKDHDWLAQAFVVTGPAANAGPGLITMYTPGFEWGWKNRCVDRPVGGYVAAPNTSPSLPTMHSSSPIAPGETVSLSAIPGATMTLTKGSDSANVALIGASVTATIDGTIDAGGITAFTINSGSGQFAPYLFGTDSVGTSNFTVQGGNGAIHWGTRQVSVHVVLVVTVAGFPAITATADGTGTVDSGLDDVTMDADSLGVEIVSTAVPLLSAVGLALLGLLLLGVGVALYRRELASAATMNA